MINSTILKEFARKNSLVLLRNDEISAEIAAIVGGQKTSIFVSLEPESFSIRFMEVEVSFIEQQSLETEEMLEEVMRFVNACRSNEVHVFSHSILGKKRLSLSKFPEYFTSYRSPSNLLYESLGLKKDLGRVVI